MENNGDSYLGFLRKSLLVMPAVTERPCYGTPAFFVGKKLFARMKEDGKTLMVQTFERDKWMEKDPDTFFITDHYLKYNCVLVNLQTVTHQDLIRLLSTGWYNQATSKIRGI